MTDMTQLGNKIVEDIHSTEEYKTYINLRREVEKDPALLLRVTELMEKNSRLHQTDSEELFELCDRVTVMRDGEHILTEDISNMTDVRFRMSMSVMWPKVSTFRFQRTITRTMTLMKNQDFCGELMPILFIRTG